MIFILCTRLQYPTFEITVKFQIEIEIEHVYPTQFMLENLWKSLWFWKRLYEKSVIFVLLLIFWASCYEDMSLLLGLSWTWDINALLIYNISAKQQPWFQISFNNFTRHHFDWLFCYENSWALFGPLCWPYFLNFGLFKPLGNLTGPISDDWQLLCVNSTHTEPLLYFLENNL